MELTKITQEELNKLLDKHEEWSTKGSLCYCNLSCYDLSNLDFCNRNLKYASLYKSDCTNANLTNANLENVDFSNSNLTNTNFANANLKRANFYDSNLTNTNFTNAKGIEQICPLEGEFIGWKKCRDDRIVELLIPADALRSNGNYSRKCRCSKAKVLSIKSKDGKNNYDMAYSMADWCFAYKVGEMVEPDGFDTNRFNECTHGIHFFMTRKEAVEYEMW